MAIPENWLQPQMAAPDKVLLQMLEEMADKYEQVGETAEMRQQLIEIQAELYRRSIKYGQVGRQ